MSFNWIEIKVINPPAVLEELSPLFFRMGFEGITEQKDYFLLYILEMKWTAEKKKELNGILHGKNISAENVIVTKIANQNWNENWKENFKIFQVGENIIIQPDWENYQGKKDETVIKIAPKMAFGTGHHETTKLILRQMEKLIREGMTVLDAGTGSGILAIYAAKKGAHKVVAFDNDPEAIINARENGELNDLNDKIQFITGEIDKIKPVTFDLITANINRNILLIWPDKLRIFGSVNTKLVLSGILKSDAPDIKKCYSDSGWILQKSDQLGEWISLTFKM